MIRPAPRHMAIAAAAFLLSGCATWSTGTVHQSPQQQGRAAAATDPAHVQLTQGDLKRPYVSLGDITVHVNKTTVFNKSPTREQVNEKLKERAAKMGADAVVLVRYGEVGVSVMTWGSLEGKGRAVKFK